MGLSLSEWEDPWAEGIPGTPPLVLQTWAQNGGPGALGWGAFQALGAPWGRRVRECVGGKSTKEVAWETGPSWVSREELERELLGLRCKREAPLKVEGNLIGVCVPEVGV